MNCNGRRKKTYYFLKLGVDKQPTSARLLHDHTENTAHWRARHFPTVGLADIFLLPGLVKSNSGPILETITVLRPKGANMIYIQVQPSMVS